MPRSRGVGQQGRGAGERGGRGGRGRVTKPRCARSLRFPISVSGNAEAVEPTPVPSGEPTPGPSWEPTPGPSWEPTPGPSRQPTPGPSGEQSRPKSLMEQLKALKVAKTLDARNLAKLSPSQKKKLVELRERKQVGNFRMPDSPQPKEGKKKVVDTRVWRPCPLLPGVPTVPPPHVPQPWELKRSDDITEEEEEEDAIEGTPPKLTIPHKMFARAVQSAGTPPRAAPDSVMIPLMSTVESCLPSEEVGRTSPRTKKRSIQYSHHRRGSCRVPNHLQVRLKCWPTLNYSDLHLLLPLRQHQTRSGRSVYEIDLNRDFLEPGEGSDVEPEPEDNLDITLRPRNVQQYPESQGFEDPSLADAMLQIDTAADAALRTVVGPEQDLLHFDWQSDPENFDGVREVFTVPSTGPTFSNAELTPLEVFLKIWDTDIIAHIVRETNRYGGDLFSRNRKPHSRLNRWKDVTDDEILKYFAIIMLQSLVVNNVEREYWYPKFEELRIGDFRAIMSYNRFLVIKHCLHFVDNTSLPEHPNRLDKIMPVIEHLNNKFSSIEIVFLNNQYLCNLLPVQ